MFESYIKEDSQNGKLARTFLDTLLNENTKKAIDLILNSYNDGISIKSIYIDVFQTCLYEIGRLWEIDEISIAKEHYLTAAVQLAMSQFYPYIFNGYRNGKVVASCVGNELHEIGIRMVADFFEMDGWETYYLGSNLPLESIIQEVKNIKPDILALSATVESNVDNIKGIIKQVRRVEDISNIKILVGGRPFILNDGLWKLVGADGFGQNGEIAVKKARELMLNG